MCFSYYRGRIDSDGDVLRGASRGITINRGGPNGAISSISDPAGNSVAYGYDGSGNLASVTDLVGNTSTFTYDSSHLLTGALNPLGVQPITNTYNASGRLISTTDATGKSIAYAYNLTTDTTTVTDRMGYQTQMTYDEWGNVTSQSQYLLNPNGTVNQTLTTTSTFGDSNNPQKPTKVIDPMGRETDYVYDANGDTTSTTMWHRVTPSSDAIAVATSATYNGYSQMLTQTDPMGIVTTRNAYDKDGNLTSTTDALGNATAYTHNADGTVHTTTDALQHATTYGYDSYGDVTSVTDTTGHATTFQYDVMGNKTAQSTTRTTSISGLPQTQTLTTQFQYDDENRLVETVAPDGAVTQTIYNANGQVGQTVDAMGRVTQYSYDNNGNAVAMTIPGGRTAQAGYDSNGNKIMCSDADGHVVEYIYDSLNRQVEQDTYGTGSTIVSSKLTKLDDDGEAIATTDGNNNTTTYVYDDLGRKTSTTDALGNVVEQTSYDLDGRKLSSVDGNGNTTAYEYDNDGRLLQTTYADGTTSSEAVDPLGNRISSTDQAGLTTLYSFDALSRPTAVTTPMGNVVRSTYDQIGQKVAQVNADGESTTFTYDMCGRQNGKTLPKGQSMSDAYNPDGNPSSETDYNGHTVYMQYDADGRLAAKLDGGPTGAALTSYTYNPDDTTATETKGNVTTSYTYDVLGRVASVTESNLGTGGITTSVSYTYDAASNKKTQTTSSGTLTYDYDADERLSAVHFSTAGLDETAATVISNYIYDGAGNRLAEARANGITTTYSYDGLNRLTGLANKNAVGTVVSSYRYQLGPSGKRASATDNTGASLAYTYDADGRLISEASYSSSGTLRQTTVYNYDPAGNRTSKQVNGATVQSFTYDADDRITNAGYEYDANGNVLSDGTNGYSFDWENKLISSGPANGGTTATYTYDGEGSRVQEAQGSQYVNYTVDPNTAMGIPVEERDGSGNLLSRTDYSDSEAIRCVQGGAADYFLVDAQGSTRQITDVNGNVVAAYSYDAYGNLLVGSSSPTSAGDLLYDGQTFDPITGNYDLRARYMDPESGAFLSQDPMPGTLDLPYSMQRYLYAWDDPVNLSDPSGKDVDSIAVEVEQWILSTGYLGAYMGSLDATAFALNERYPDITSDLAAVVGSIADGWYTISTHGWPLGLTAWEMAQDLYWRDEFLGDTWDIQPLREVGGKFADDSWIGQAAVPELPDFGYDNPDARMVVVDGQTFHSYSANYVMWGEANMLSGWTYWHMMSFQAIRKWFGLWGKDVTASSAWSDAGYNGWPGYPTPDSSIISSYHPTTVPPSENPWGVVWYPAWTNDVPRKVSVEP